MGIRLKDKVDFTAGDRR